MEQKRDPSSRETMTVPVHQSAPILRFLHLLAMIIGHWRKSRGRIHYLSETDLRHFSPRVRRDIGLDD